MKSTLAVACLLMQLASVNAQPANPAPIQSAMLGTALPDKSSLSKGFLYREAARLLLKLNAESEGVTLGPKFEVFQLAMTAPPQAEILNGFARAGWAIRMNPAEPTSGVADKAGAPSVLLTFVNGKNDRWLYVAEIAQRNAPAGAAPGSAAPAAPAVTAAPVSNAPAEPPTERGNSAQAANAAAGDFAFHTTNFDDGWVSAIGANFVRVSKGDLRVLLHYKRVEDDRYMSVLEDETRLFWNLLVAPRYRDVANLFVERNNPGGYQAINYAAGTVVDNETGRRVYVVLFNHRGRNTRWMEFVTPDKATFEREFGPYLQNSTAWDRWVAMAGRNRFAVAARDFGGTWSDNFASGTSMVYAATGRSAGMLYAGGNTTVSFSGGSYTMDVAGATGYVGNIQTRNVSYKGPFTVLDNWNIEFGNNFQGRPRRFHASFEGVPGGRVLNLVLDEPGAGITLHLVRVK
jgi:hypothetical protein